MIYLVQFKHLVEQTVIAKVEADSEEEAIIYCEDGEIEDEEVQNEQGLETSDYKVIGTEE